MFAGAIANRIAAAHVLDIANRRSRFEPCRTGWFDVRKRKSKYQATMKSIDCPDCTTIVTADQAAILSPAKQAVENKAVKKPAG